MTTKSVSSISWKRPTAAATALAAVLLLGACASNRDSIPAAELTQARSAITQAEAAGAGQMSPVELLAAREKLVRAESEVRAERYGEAKRLAEQAAADAELAERKARVDRAKKAADEMKRSNDTLQQEIRK
jgi:uncharacterized membrane protein YdfJ with MMPL/SSD domain